ncbi:putative methyltransferase DDB_G0268948 [Tubulanus polymorphus]|uniref:putative methyltransferase DDB_G0268948 n=1 Tax=Tubulanus polymorphus TaxID=672921 RepID=UPI003DA310BF
MIRIARFATVLHTSQLNRYYSNDMEYRRFEDKDHVARYAKARFSYPQELKEAVLEFLAGSKMSPPFGQLVDVGCGSGQSTPLFVDQFQTLIGVDPSPAQIDEAKKRNQHQNITYQVKDAYSLPVKDSSTDLVTSAMAAHWFDLPKFYEEVRRILKPGGVVAIWGYKYPDIEYEGHPEASERASEVIKQVYAKEWIENGWRPQIATVCDRHYADLPVCFTGSEKRFLTRLDLRRTLDEYLLLVSTHSGFQKIKEAHPDWDYMNELKQRLLDALGNPNSAGETQLIIKNPIFMFMSRKS